MAINPFSLLYFPTFYFKNGGSKPKYFIPLYLDGSKLIIASLPSSQDFVPDDIKKYGCIEYPDKCISCFHFPSGKIICDDSGFAFPLDTFIYLDQIDDYDKDIFESVYPVEGIDYHTKGSLSKSIKEDLLKCILNSSRVKNKIKRYLSV
ncbi:hypothetical protein [Flagellimonas amoyensis]|uniref:hypothetical protein n=1 Tax=Flagellimonas amoyensis TaxID=2169401 RepID=UPI000D3428AE|nr:hypothetical protein [Allomuricauda amoyensis]